MSTEDLSATFKALGHPRRLAIVERLMEQALACCEADRPDRCSLDPTCCNFGELSDELDVGQATVSHHLTELERAGLIERRKEGRRVYVRVDPDRLATLCDFLTVDAAAPSSSPNARAEPASRS